MMIFTNRTNKSDKTIYNRASSIWPVILPALVLSISFSFILTGCSLIGTDAGGEGISAGYSYIQDSNFDAAIKVFENMVSTNTNTEKAYRGLGITYMGMGDYDSAIENFEKALSESGAVPSAYEFDINFYLGTAFYKNGEYEEARAVYDAIIALRPNNADSYILRGTVNYALGDEEAMLEDYQKAVSIDTTDYDRLVTVYEKLTENGFQDEAISFINQAIAKHGDNMDDYNRGRLAYYAQDYQTARSCLEKVNDGKNMNVAILLGQTYEELGDFNYAISVYEAYLETDPTKAEVFNQLGLCNIRMHNYEDALSAFQNGMKVEGNTIMQSLSFNEISAYEYLGDFQRAQILMEEYIAKYPSDTKAQREYKFLQTR